MTGDKQAAGRACPPAIALEAFLTRGVPALAAPVDVNFSGMKGH